MRVNLKSIETVFDDFFKIEKAVLQYEKFDGTMTRDLVRLNFNRGNSVAVLLYNPENHSVILTRQFRYPAYASDARHGWVLEIVAGMQDDLTTSFEEVAQKEVLEETGYCVKNLTRICEFFPSPGGSSEKIVLYYGEVSANEKPGVGGGKAGEGEDIEVLEIDTHKAMSMLQSGEICDAKTIIALQWLEKELSRK